MHDLQGPELDRDPLNVFRHILAVVLMAVCVTMMILEAGADKAVYLGGTLSGAREKAEGRLLATSDQELLFEAGERGSIAIPYTAITSVEYGQKAGRNVDIPTVSNGLPLIGRGRAHVLTIAFKDRTDREQAGAFELGEDIVRPTLKILEVRTGREIAMQDQEACLQVKLPEECGR